MGYLRIEEAENNSGKSLEFERSLYLLWECVQKKKTPTTTHKQTVIPLIDFWAPWHWFISVICFPAIFFRFLLPQRLCLPSAVWGRLLLWPDWSGGPSRSLCCRILLPHRLFRGSRYAMPLGTLLPFGNSSSSALPTWNNEKWAKMVVIFYCYRLVSIGLIFLYHVIQQFNYNKSTI